MTLLALLLYLTVALLVDGSRIAAALSRVGPGAVALVLLLSLFNYGLRFGRWQAYVRWQGFDIAVLRSLAIYLGGFALTVSPGKAGEAVRSLYLHEEGMPYRASLAMLFVERLQDLLAILVLSALLLGARTDLAWALGGFLALLLVFIFAVTRGATPALIGRAGARLGGKTGSLLAWLGSTLEHAHALMSAPRLLCVLAVSVLAWGAEGYGVSLLVGALGHQIGVPEAIGIYGLAVLAGAAAVFLPAGLGGTEAAMTALLVAAGLPLAEAVAVTLICRLATLWFAVAIGVIALSVLELVIARRGKTDTLHEEGRPA